MLRATDPVMESGWLVVIQSPDGRGGTDTETEWCEGEDTANRIAIQALNDARDGVYHINVYVLQSVRQATVDSNGKLEK